MDEPDRIESTFKIFRKIHYQLKEEFEIVLSFAFRDYLFFPKTRKCLICFVGKERLQ